MQNFSFPPKHIFLLLFLSILCTDLRAQPESYDLLKFNIPQDWQQQSRSQWISYTGTDKETNIAVEIIIHKSQAAAPKIDSSFKAEWKRILDSNYGKPPAPFAKKKYAVSGIQYVENGAELVHNGHKIYSELFVFIIGKQLQTIQLVTDKPTSYKALRPFVDEFLETVDTVQKRE